MMITLIAILALLSGLARGQAVDSFPFSRLPFRSDIPTSQLPLLITITWDDSVTPYTSWLFSKIAKTKDPHTGCYLKSTFYVSIEGNTKCEFVQGLRKGGHEIGTHTLDHKGTPSVQQIQGAVDWLADNCGVPPQEMRGFRTPFLNWDDSTLQNLHQLGFLYDSSIGPTDHIANNQGADHTWPFTFDQANIDQFENGKPNIDITPAPGLWEIPMWSLYDTAGQAVIPMDYPNPNGPNSVIPNLIHPNFLKHYNGNRAPLGLFFHASWLVANGDAFAAWIQDIMNTYTDVFFVTSYELLQYMKNPVPASQFVQSCPNQQLCFAPRDTGCLFGKFNGETCQCDCTPPYCRGPDGACTEYTNCPVAPTTPIAPVMAPVAAPVPPYTGPGCCSQTFKSCDVTWCGTTEAQCNACSGQLKWLANGPLTNCMANWAWGCSKDTDCCDGLVCSASSCTPGIRSPTPVAAPVPVAPVPVPTPIAAPVPVPSPVRAPVPAPSPVRVPTPVAPVPVPAPVRVPTPVVAPVPVPSPVVAPLPAPSPVVSPVSTQGCCSQDALQCNVNWCGTTQASCKACGSSYTWLANGAPAAGSCLARWATCGGSVPCCPGTFCDRKSQWHSSCEPGPTW
ncbi:hypothetical protein FisN_14Hh346 [Fistulifera solaris]|uniref:NodB homology domain-containing protein n=1 Tax=Fistulifera solaris TaxID=1519565 RepID=A0A1Z5KB41_FISSO|nr:hypothetical protein FisN_14Hh346 [Fistulifera solaris]|eukprot:GAX23484.1 hypothetical protein FisN_14Hh346 [Fistulifera solaris]